MRFPSDSPASQARLARAIEKERAARMPKTTRGPEFEKYLQEIGHPAAPQTITFVECSTCEGSGEIDETLGGISTSNRHAKCPDCDGDGGHEIATPPQDPRAQEQAALVPEWNDGKPHADGRYECSNEKLESVFLYFRSGHWYPDDKCELVHGSRCYGQDWLWKSPTPAERAQSGGWIEHDGKDTIMPAHTRIEWKARDGRSATCEWGELGGKHWDALMPRNHDIVAYRIQP